MENGDYRSGSAAVGADEGMPAGSGRKGAVPGRLPVWTQWRFRTSPTWLKKKELLLTTGYVLRQDTGALLKLIEALHNAQSAGIAIKTRFFGALPGGGARAG